MQRYFISCVCLCAFYHSIPTALASPWGQPAGEKLSIERIEYFKATEDGRAFEQFSSQTYSETGLTDRITFGTKLTYVWQEIDQPRFYDAREGFSDLEVFAQYKFKKSDHAVWGLQAAYAASSDVQSVFLGNSQQREDAAQVSLLYGRGQGNYFIGSSLGIRHSLGDDATQVRSDQTIGHKNPQGRLLLFDINSTFSLRDQRPAGIDYDVISISPSAVFPLNKWFSLQFGASSQLAGRNVDLGSSLFTSIWVSL